MTGPYPEITPCEHGMLEVGDGNLTSGTMRGSRTGAYFATPLRLPTFPG